MAPDDVARPLAGAAGANAEAGAGTATGIGSSSVTRRRPHRKSRDGCAECKRRHIRCDKGRPACTNCTIAERTCAYPSSTAASASAAGASSSSSARAKRARKSPSVHSPHSAGGNGGMDGVANGDGKRPPPVAAPLLDEPITPAATASPLEAKPAYPRLPFHVGAFPDTSTPPPPSPSLPQLGPSSFTAKDLVLLHHASTSMPDSILGRGQSTYIIDIGLRYACESPYLIDQLLAFASLHLAYLQSSPSAAEPFRHQATELQTRALAYFTNETEQLNRVMSQHDITPKAEVPPATDDPYEAYHGVPRFLFATTIGLHVLAETLLYHHDDLDAFLTRFVECINLLRGVRTVVKPTWEGLLQSEVGPLFSAVKHVNSTRQRGAECDSLLERIKSQDRGGDVVDDAAKETCLETAEHLQWAFDMQNRLSDSEGPHAPSAFSVVVPGPFVDLLRLRNPLALVVLAYFGVLVHRARRFWIFGESGTFLIRSIASHLGSSWEEALRWPAGQLEM